MASRSSLYFLLVFLHFFTSFVPLSGSQKTPKQHKFVLPVHQDTKTNLYVADIYKRTPPFKVPFVVDLNGKLLWVTCEQNYLSSTYHAPQCHSTQCNRASTDHWCNTCASKARPGCHNNTCGIVSMNPVTRLTSKSELAQDVLSMESTQGSNPGPLVRIPRFLFACAPSLLLQKGLPGKVQGVAGFGHSPISLPNQLASHFGESGLAPKFALCLAHNGVIFFGDGPYFMAHGVDISRPLSYTPLIISPQGEYHLEVRSIKINNREVPLNKNLLSMDKQGTGGTMLSTTHPYTILEHSIFKAVTECFAKEMSNTHKVKPVQPFGACFESKSIKNTKAGPEVPNIDLVLHDQHVVWRISGTNSIVQASQEVSCLGFVDGGTNTRASVIIGAHQLQENLVQFDMAKSRLGFSSSLQSLRTSCNQFNFTSVP